MQYIDKSVHREEGNRITLQYLEDIKIEDEQRYPVDYNNSFRILPQARLRCLPWCQRASEDLDQNSQACPEW